MRLNIEENYPIFVVTIWLCDITMHMNLEKNFDYIEEKDKFGNFTIP